MSSEVDTPADPQNCPKTSEGTREDMESEDIGMAQSSILYLLQEATKLVTPPVQNGLGKEPLQGGTRKTLASHTSTNAEPNVQKLGSVESLAAPSFTGAFSMLSSSPWEAMSLINLQCEMLLQSGEPRGEGGGGQRAHNTKIDSKTGERDAVQEWSSFLSTVSTSSASLKADAKERAMESEVCCFVPHIPDPTDHLTSQSSSESHSLDLAELISNATKDSSLFSRLSDNRTDHCSLVETLVLPLDLTKKAAICEQTLEGVNDMASVSFISDAAQSPGISSVDFTSSLVAEKYEEPCFSFNKEHVVCDCALVSEMPASRTDLNNNLEDEALQVPEKTYTTHSAQAACSNRRRKPRKQAHPARSPDLNDSGLQGVTFTMHTELEHSTDQCRLIITSNYSKLCRGGRRSRSRIRRRARLQQHSQQTSSSGDDSDLSGPWEKTCASCCTRKTPLWRDAEDGTPLCNACGIRYKKYGVRCLQCWNIPRKEASFTSKCSKCGELLPFASQSKQT